MTYVALHVHCDMGSMMDGTATTQEYVDRAVSLGMPALAITDHGTLVAHRQFHRQARAAGIKPILGMEAYIAKDRFDKRAKASRTEPLDMVYNHILLIAKNKAGYDNLNKLSEIAWTEGFHSKPRIDFEVLEKYKDGLVVSSGCMSGLLNKAIDVGEEAVAKEHVEWFMERFGDDFYIEVMPHNVDGMNEKLVELAKATGAKLLATPDCHHATVDQKVIQEIMLIANTHPKNIENKTYASVAGIEDNMEKLDALYGHDRMLTFNKFDIHLLSEDEMEIGLSSIDENGELHFEPWALSAIANTNEVNDKVEEFDLPTNLDLLPATYRQPDKELRESSLAGLKAMGLDNPEYLERLEMELDVIKSKGFAPYFLMIRDAVNFARESGILVGPGRGSGAGSLVNYSQGITRVDPIKFKLEFFRFLDPEREDWPDVDLDFEDRRRDEIKQYTIDKYRFVGSIATFNAFKDKGVVRDVARVFAVPLADVNKALKTVDTWDEFISSPNTRDFRNKYPEIVEYADRLRGRIRATGIHASGVVASKVPLSSVAPMETRKPTGKDRIPVVGLDMDEAANLGLIKMDFLGLKALSTISDTLKSIKERHGRDIDLYGINMEDPNVYKMLSDGHTLGVFQCEAAPYTSLLSKMGVSAFDELVVSNALVRPGAMNTIGKDYILRKKGLQSYSMNAVMEPYVRDTYGEIIYQEQVMQACVHLGGMTMIEANKVRRVIGKKKDASELDPFRSKFVQNASKIIGRDEAEQMWTDFEAHSGYSFNKSHAVAYSTISYWTAWLKYYYRLEFMYATLKNEGDKDSRTQYMIEARRLGITIHLPHINLSDVDFSIEGEAIRVGLASVKFVSDTIASRYIEQRPFKSKAQVEKYTFTKGSGVNSRAMAALNAVGALTFADNPADMNVVKKNLYEYLNLPEFGVSTPPLWEALLSHTEDFDEDGAFVLMGIVTSIKRGSGWSRVELMDKTGSIGIFDKEDTAIEPGKSYLLLVGANRIVDSLALEEVEKKPSPIVDFLNHEKLPMNEDEVFVLSFTQRITKKGDRMGTLVVADSDRDLAALTVFPSKFGEAYIKIEPGNAYKIGFSESRNGGLVFNSVQPKKSEVADEKPPF